MTRLDHADGKPAIDTMVTDERVQFEPWTDGYSLGFKVTDLVTRRVEYVVFTPSRGHDVNPDNGASADVFVHHISEADLIDGEDIMLNASFDSPVTYINLLEGSAS